MFNVNRDIINVGDIMKKISILSLHLGYGGIEKCVAALANMLCDQYDVSIICCYKLYDEPVFFIDPKVHIEYLMPDLKPNREKFLAALHKKEIFSAFIEGVYSTKVLILKKRRMIHYIKHTSSDIMIATRDIFDDWLGEYGSENIVKIGWEHNHYHNDLKYAGNITKSAWNLDYLVLVSSSLKNFYSKELFRSKCKCIFIPNMIDYMPDSIAPLENKRLISVGRLSPEKGYLDLLKIYVILKEKHPDWTLDIIGDGPERDKIEKFIKAHNLEKHVFLHGFRKKDYIDKMLHESSIYLMASYTESFGIVLIEAMSHGVPCIAFSSAEGARELIISGKNGYLIKNRNHSAMIKKIEDLMNNYNERKRIGDSSREEAYKYTKDNVQEKWSNIIEKK